MDWQTFVFHGCVFAGVQNFQWTQIQLHGFIISKVIKISSAECHTWYLSLFSFVDSTTTQFLVSRKSKLLHSHLQISNFLESETFSFPSSRHRSWRGFNNLVSQVCRISLNSNVRTFALPSFWDFAFYESSSFEVLEPSALKVPGSSIVFKCTDCKIPWLWPCVISVLCKLTLPKYPVSHFLYFRDFAFLCNLTPPKILYSQFLHSRDVTFLWNLTFPAFTYTQFLHFRDVQFLWNSRHPKSRCLQFLHFPGFPISVKSHNFRKSVFDSFLFLWTFQFLGNLRLAKLRCSQCLQLAGFSVSVKAHTSQVHGFTAFTFSGFCVSVKSPITDIDGFTVFTSSGLCILWNRTLSIFMDSWFSHFRALPFRNIQMSWSMQL